jgi:ribonuclease G
MQAAFVDIGLNQAAFIYVDDVYINDFKEYERMFEINSEEADSETENEPDPLVFENKRNFLIEELLLEDQQLLAQVTKSPIGTKGARISSYISLPGRFLVLMPTSDHIGISRRIEDQDERERLRSAVQNLRTNNYGYIIRTAAEGEAIDKLFVGKHR